MTSKWKENKFSQELTRRLKSRNAWVTNFSGHCLQMPGISDIHVQHMYWDGWIELKVDSNDFSNEQLDFSQQQANRGANALGAWYLNGKGAIKVRVFRRRRDWKEYMLANIDDFVTYLLRKDRDTIHPNRSLE